MRQSEGIRRVVAWLSEPSTSRLSLGSESQATRARPPSFRTAAGWLLSAWIIVVLAVYLHGMIRSYLG